MEATYLVPECNLPTLLEAVEKLNKRAARLGVPAVTVTTKVDHLRHQVRQLTVDGHTSLCWRTSIEKTPADQLPASAFLANAFEPTGVVMAWHSVAVSGTSPMLCGWEIVAVLEPLAADDGTVLNFVRAIPGQTCPPEYRTRIGVCDHCRAARRRKETFVVRHTDGTVKSVGRQCLKDFLGYHADPHALAHLAELMAQLGGLCEAAEDFDEDGYGSGGRGETAWNLDHFLMLTACRIRLFGWLSRTVARERADYGDVVRATADLVIELLTPPPAMANEDCKRTWREFSEQHVATPEDITTAEAAVEWARNFTEQQVNDSDYLANCNTVARVGYVTRKMAGVAASIVSSYLREQNKLKQAERRAARPESNWVGTVGERIDQLVVTCEKVILSDGQYGLTGIHKLTDAVGNDLTWFASGGEKIAEGETVTIAATVKDHGEYKGRKQTVVTRCVVWTEQGLVEARAKAERKAKRLAKAAK